MINNDNGSNSLLPIKKKLKKKKSQHIYNPEFERYTEDEARYYNGLDTNTKQHVAELEIGIKNVHKSCDDDIPMRFKFLKSNMDIRYKAIAIEKLESLMSMTSDHSEYYKLDKWLTGVSRIPFGIYKPLPVSSKSPRNEIKSFLQTTRAKLDERVYGHQDAKEHLVRLLAQWISNPNSNGLVLGIQGSMGVGKTSLVKEGICKALDIPLAFIPLGGVDDSKYLVGHELCYIGSNWGHIINSIMNCKCMNPVLYFDELDKVSNTDKGAEIINILIHMTDVVQNDKFQDKYFADFEFDLSKCIMIFTYNDESLINPILKDRMIKIKTKGYTIKDKVEIAKTHMIPSILKEFGMDLHSIVFNDQALQYLINYVEPEQGVRNMKHALHLIVSNINYEIFVKDTPLNIPLLVTTNMIKMYVKNNHEHITHSHMYI